MKIFKYTLCSVIILIMSGLTLLGFSDLSTDVFTGGSISSFINIAPINKSLSLTLLILFITVVIIYLRTMKFYILIILSMLFFLWLSAGRTIGFSAFPDGRISSGWYFLENNKFNLCNSKSDCDNQIAYNTSIEKLSFWRVKIENNKINKTILIGPINYRKVIDMLDKNIGNGTYTN